MKDDDCVFCRELAGSRLTNFASRYPELDSRVIRSSPSLVAFPCIGQLVPGHFLIVPRQHFCTFRHAQVSNAGMFDEVMWLLREVHEVQGLSWRHSLLFEHGARQPADGGCGIYHAHVHVLPGACKVCHEEAYCFDASKWSDSPRSAWTESPETSYVLVGSGQAGFKWESLAGPLPSQTLRKNVARALGVYQWDWREATREGEMFAALGVMGFDTQEVR